MQAAVEMSRRPACGSRSSTASSLASVPIRSEPIPQLIFGLITLFVVARFLWPLHVSLPAKVVAAAILFVASQYLEWCRLSSGSRFSPEFPRPVVVLFNWAFGGLLFLALLQILLDAGLLVAMPFRGAAGVPDGVRYAMAALAAVTAAIGVQQAIRVPKLKDVAVGIPGLPRQFEGYTLLHLTDLHISRLYPASWARAVVDRSNALGVDLIAVTGDLIDGTVEARRADIEPLRDLRARDGVFVVSGNHENIFGYRRWMEHYASMKMSVIDNAHVVLERDGGRLTLAGLGDLSVRTAGRPVRDLTAIVEAAPRDVPIILLDHQPAEARNAARLGVALQLSGHTHGGLIVGIDRLAARPNGGFVSGRYQVEGMTLYVNNGTALWPGFALRLGRPSELTRISLHRTNAA